MTLLDLDNLGIYHCRMISIRLHDSNITQTTQTPTPEAFLLATPLLALLRTHLRGLLHRKTLRVHGLTQHKALRGVGSARRRLDAAVHLGRFQRQDPLVGHRDQIPRFQASQGEALLHRAMAPSSGKVEKLPSA